MIAPAFDPDEIMREVRTAAKLSPAATTATLRQDQAERCNVADVATPVGGAANPARGRNVADVAASAVSIGKAETDEETQAAIDERAGLASDRVPALYHDAWGRLHCQKPANVSDFEWRLALADGGLFLDAWGNDAATLGWTPGDLFDVVSGLVWRLCGGRIEVMGVDHVRLGDGRVLERCAVLQPAMSASGAQA